MKFYSWSSNIRTRRINLNIADGVLDKFNFLTKNSPNLFASTTGSSCGGRSLSQGSLQRNVTILNNFLESPAH